MKARKIIKEFKPDLAIGVGGYASGPVLWVAARFGIPILIQEQNSCAGVTNKLLARKAGRICVAYEGMEQFFPAEKIILTGNPVREEIISIRSPGKKEEGLKHFGLTDRFRVLLVMGGSLGARTINESVIRGLGEIREAGVQLVWQCGKYYLEEARKALDSSGITSVVMTDFISRVDLAFAVSDVIIARAGAITISELFHAGKPVILVPSPNVAGDHQTKNAMALVNKTAAICIRDHEARDLLVKKALELINNEEMIRKLSDGISGLAIRDSAERIIREAMALIA